MRSSLRALLEGEAGIELVAETADLVATIDHVYLLKPDVLVFGLNMPDSTGCQTIAYLRDAAPETAIVVTTMIDHPGIARSSKAAGAHGLIEKHLADSELPQAIRAAALDHAYVTTGGRTTTPRRATALGGRKRCVENAASQTGPPADARIG